MTLAERMLDYRAKENISQKELARRVGVTLQTVNSIETRQQTPSRLTVAKIELIIGKDEKNNVED